jgi:predicted deacetylase
MATYLLRFDDICPTMNWTVWDQIEPVLIELGIRPILAVVPDNQDQKLRVSEAHTDFWDRVRMWQSMGWTIGLHGYQHVGTEPSVPHERQRSEFTGLSPEAQEGKLRRAVQLFTEQRVTPSIWVAPWHAFDDVTVQMLKHVGIRAISDGPGLFPYEDHNGVIWCPQQMWRLVRLPFGVFTVCIHINSWIPPHVDSWLGTIRRFAPRIGDPAQLVATYAGRPKSNLDKILWGSARLSRRAASTFRVGRQRGTT